MVAMAKDEKKRERYMGRKYSGMAKDKRSPVRSKRRGDDAERSGEGVGKQGRELDAAGGRWMGSGRRGMERGGSKKSEMGGWHD
jgi:hypothetical protein